MKLNPAPEAKLSDQLAAPMLVKKVISPVLWMIVGAIIYAGVLKLSSPSPTRNQGTDVTVAGSDAAPVLKSKAVAVPLPDSLAARIARLPSPDPKHPDPQRAALILEWLAKDRPAALRYLAANHFEDLLCVPGLEKAIGEKATAPELLQVVNFASAPVPSLMGIGQWASPAVINELAGLSSSFSSDAKAPAAYALARLLADVNLDRAVAYAMNQDTEQVRGQAFAGLFETLAGRPNGDVEVRKLYAALPASVRSQDMVVATYGLAIWNSDPIEALQAMASIQDPQQRKIDSIILANHAASTAPELAIAALYQSGLSAQGISNHVGPIIQKWYSVDPQAAANFIATTTIIPASDKAKYGPPKG